MVSFSNYNQVGRRRRTPCQAYLQGLWGETSRKHVERMALALGKRVRNLQYFVGQSPAAQYCGLVGKVANGQVGVYLGYASRKGYSLVEGQLFVAEAWLDEAHAEKREACGVPNDLGFQTKPEIGLKLVEKAKKRGSLPFQWVAADEFCTGIRPLFGMESTLCFWPVSCQGRFLIRLPLWSECAITRNETTSPIALIASQNLLNWLP